MNSVNLEVKPNSWCSDVNSESDGYVIIDTSNISKPFSFIINSISNSVIGISKEDCVQDRIF
ncbi:MAG: hypothetical protein K2H20_00795, partial [Bacilli bacterium]|nr:hypothetical protein [Bacilli bacterium]